jgi:DNA repair photolyase
MTKKNNSKKYQLAYAFDVSKEGIYYEKLNLREDDDFRKTTALIRFGEGARSIRRCHYLTNSDSLLEIENMFRENAARGRKGKALFILGYHSDPFSNFDHKFKTVKKFLELYAKYRPGKLVIQTYSDLIVLGLSSLLPIKDLLTINIIIESGDQDLAQIYSPSKVNVIDRLKTANSLKNFTFDVEIQVAPLLPYRGGKLAARNFAQQLVKSCNRVYIASFASCAGNKTERLSPLAQHIVTNQLGSWLRKGAANELREEIARLSPAHLEAPEVYTNQGQQLGLFVA